MISRSAVSKPKIERQVQVLRKREPARKSLLDKVWEQTGGSIENKYDLQMAMKKANVSFLPDEPTEEMAVALLMHNKACEQKDFVHQYGVGYFTWHINLWKQKIDLLFQHIKSNDI